MITVEKLKERLDYDAETGNFYWKLRVNGYNYWNSRWAGKIAGCKDSYGYIIITIDDKPYKAHILAWLYVTGNFPERPIDHKDLCKSNNRFINLREASWRDNACNRPRKKSKSGYSGVQFTRSGKWRALIRINGVYTHLGIFSTLKEAVKVCDDARKEHHGEFAKIEGAH